MSDDNKNAVAGGETSPMQPQQQYSRVNRKFLNIPAFSKAAQPQQQQAGAQEDPGSQDSQDAQQQAGAPAQSGETKRARRFIDPREASVFSRVKAFTADAIIIFFTMTIISGILWRPIQTVFWGRPFISKEAYYDRQSGKVTDPPGTPKYYKMVNFHNEPRYYRDTSLKEKFISFNIDYPLLPIILYFAFMWAAAGASFGQMYANNVVAMCEDDGKPNVLEALTRSVVFVFSIGFFGIGALMYFGEENLTLYDKLCGTKVLEIQ